MNPVKIAAMIMILTAGLLGSYFIIKNSAPKNETYKSLTEVKKTIDDIAIQNPIKWLKDLASTTYPGLENSVNVKKINNQVLNSQRSANLTKLVAKSMFSRMKEMDQNSDNPFKNFNLDDSANQKLIEEIVKNSDFSSFFDWSINEEEIKISLDNSSSNKARYLEEAGKIILENSNDFYNNPSKSVEKAIMSGEFSGAWKLTEAYEMIFNGFINLEVPSDWLDLHRRYLSALKKSKIIYQGVLDIKDDPIKTGLLIELMPEAVEQEKNLKMEYYQLASGNL